MRILPFLPLIALFACQGAHEDTRNATTAADTLATPAVATTAADTGNVITLTPLTESGLRFDGVYYYRIAPEVTSLCYYIRFFERGNAALVGGTENYQGELAKLLTANVQSGWNQIHNVPVTLRNDSILLRTMALKGEITYDGVVYANGDSVRFNKFSASNNNRMFVRYGFVPDGSLQQQ